MSIFTPNYIVDSVTDIDPNFLLEKGIKGIILDVDNTLTKCHSQDISKEISDWIFCVKSMSIKVMILSNNTYERISPLAKNLDIEFFAMGWKPMGRGFLNIKSQFCLKSSEIAVIGDQIYTDILGGNLKKMYTILVSPILRENGVFSKIKRKFEKIHIKKYNSKK